jgi:hypothetical protein
MDDAKAQAALHGIRITAASVAAARTLRSRMDAPSTSMATVAPTSPSRATPPPRAKAIPFDLESLVRGVVTKVQGQGNAEVKRLREGIRKAIAGLQALVD